MASRAAAARGDITRPCRNLRYPVVVEADEDGCYVPCLALQGCYWQSETYEQAIANIKDVICLHIDDRGADIAKTPAP